MFSIEVITLPVSDPDRALRFYVDQVGFTLDVDYAPTDTFRVVQLTPPRSGCSIQIGTGLTDAPAGSVANTYLIVTDLEFARSALVEAGVEVSETRHAGFSDPDATAGCFTSAATRRSDGGRSAEAADPRKEAREVGALSG